MGSFLSKATQLLSKNWKKLAKPFAAIVGLFGAAGIGAWIERRKAEKEKAKLTKVIRKHEAEILALESQSKQNWINKLQIKRLESENAQLRERMALVEESLQNV